MATEKRMIDANALGRDAFHIKQWGKGIRCVVDWDDIEAAPTVDAVEVVHGRWIWRGGCFHCSNCKTSNDHTPAYCEGCGAMMDGDGNG